MKFKNNDSFGQKANNISPQYNEDLEIENLKRKLNEEKKINSKLLKENMSLKLKYDDLINSLRKANFNHEKESSKNLDLNKRLEKSIQQLNKEQGDIDKNQRNSQNLQNKLDEICNEINKGQIAENLIKTRNENEKLKNEIKIINRNTKNSELMELSRKLNIELEGEKNKILNYKNIEEIQNKKNMDFENYKKNDYNEEFIGKELSQFYDIIINIKSIIDLCNPDGWPIKWNKERKQLLDNIKNKEIFKIGVLGNGNVGKSFLLSRLFNKKIPSGYSVVTEGLSLKFNEERGYVIIDSAGLQTPLINDDKEFLGYINQSKNEEDEKLNTNETEFKKYENLYRDKTQTENFIQNLIIYTSDMILIVVGKLTFNEQRLINKIKKEIELVPKNEHRKRQIYIIHNLINFQTKSQVKDHIENTLFKSASFKLKEIPYIEMKSNYNGRPLYVEKENGNDIQVYHLIMARENTEAGDYYNNYTYEILEHNFTNFTERKPLSIIEEVKERFVEWSNLLLEEKIEKENIEIVKDNDKEIKYKFEDTNNGNKKIIPKACISDELGLSIYRSNGFDPPYNFYIENDEYLIVNFEAPGNVQISDAFANIVLKEIIIEGSKIDEGIKAIENTRKFGKINLHIPYGKEIIIADEEPINGKTINENGVCVLKFKLAKRRSEKGKKK